MEIKIEKMTIQDLEKIQDILISDFDNFWNYNILKQELLNENSYLLVAKTLDGTIVGFAGVQFIIDEATVTNIVTRIKYRNNGIGSKLLQKIIDISMKKNMQTVTLEVNENNLYAISLYNKFGFKKVGLRKKYYNGIDNAILMSIYI